MQFKNILFFVAALAVSAAASPLEGNGGHPDWYLPITSPVRGQLLCAGKGFQVSTHQLPELIERIHRETDRIPDASLKDPGQITLKKAGDKNFGEIYLFLCSRSTLLIKKTLAGKVDLNNGYYKVPKVDKVKESAKYYVALTYSTVTSGSKKEQTTTSSPQFNIQECNEHKD
ncbi:hypothetical protein MPER_11034 [Moniliophthora perniciosa FA553]|nr:hypothetical protein MPER_11034 [Moniliophthora perniciosa FA553]